MQWCDAKELGAINTAYQLGRIRASNAFDLQRPPLELGDDSMTGLHVAYANYTPTVEVIAKDRALLILKHKNDRYAEARYVIDTARHVILSAERRHRGKVQSTTKFDDFVEIAGTWWARKIETLDEAGKRTALETQTIADVPAGAFAERMKLELAAKEKVLFLKRPLPKISEAKLAVAAGKATFDDRALLVLHFSATQQWSRAKEHLAECERLAKGLPGMRWLSNAYLLASRQHGELGKRLPQDAVNIVGGGDAGAKANAYFLAQSLFAEAQRVLSANELLSLWNALEAVYKDQPAHLDAWKAWRNQRVSLLQQTGAIDAALALAKALAVEYPRDAYAHYRYVQQLTSAEDNAAAFAWLDKALAEKWDASPEALLRGQYAELLRHQGRFRELADFLGKWIERNPESESPYAQYLAALVRSNRAEKAEALVGDWLRDGRVKGELPRPTAGRLTAAIAFALGNAYGFNTNRIDERWHAPLAETALHYARREEPSGFADTILQHWRFASTDAGRGVRKALAKDLASGVGTMAPERIAQYLTWIWSDSGLETDDWAKISAELRKRWDGEKDADAKHALGQVHLRVLHRFLGDDDLNFLRVQWKGASDDHRPEYANLFWQALIARPWKPEFENELFAILDQLAQPEEPAQASRIAALHRLTDAMVEARYQAAVKAVEHPEKLPRADWLKKQAELRTQARAGFADRLRAEATQQPKPFAQWLTIERLWLDVQLERDLKAVAVDCWAILDAVAPKADPDDDSSRSAVAFDAALRERTRATLMNLASRKGADAGLVERLLKHLDEPQWKGEKFCLLIALDRQQELEAELRRWIAGADPENRWRVALGYLLAEQGKTADAIKLLEAVEAADELTPDAYRSLADWYTVENRRDQAEKARAALFQTTEETTLARRLNPYLRPWRNANGRLPSQLDPEILQIFKVLFEKSEYPQSYLGILGQFYGASRDFRLLAMLPDGVVGHGPGSVYGFLNSMAGVLAELREEATADELIARLIEVRKLRTTPLDLRALDLLEVLVERRAAELQNQAGPHAAKALAALERAFKREWADGEPKLMAEFLANLGQVTRPELAREQLRQLESLHRVAKPGSFDRLHIALHWANTIHAAGKPPGAMDILEAALKEFESSHAAKLPTSANDALARFIGMIESAGQYERGEKYLLAQLGHPVHAQQGLWLTNRLHQLYREALVHGGDVSLGKGAVLYKALVKKLDTGLITPDQNQLYALLGQLVRIYRSGHDLKIPGVAGDLKAFAFERLPAILKEQSVNHDDIARDVANAVYDIAGPRDGIAFLLDRVETEPDWLRYNNRNIWSESSGRLGEWRAQVKDLGDLEPRFLKSVLAELRRDLRSRESFGRAIYDRRNSWYWAAKEADFAKVVEEVYTERKASGASVEYIAEYLFHGLPREKRAIEILFAAHELKLLTDTGEWHLLTYLHRTDRYAESIPLLLAHIRRQPDYLPYRTLLMRAYFKTGKHAELLALWTETDTFFRAKERWDESVMAMLAESTLENRLFAESVKYYEELLPQYQKEHPGRGVGDGRLHAYYLNAADAYAGLGRTKEAVDRAGAAVVIWPAGHQQRKETLERLGRILDGAAKLNEFIAALDAEKLQSAVVRKALGQSLIRKGEHARAIPQLRLAAELQPNDAEVYELLVACFDKIGDKEGAVAQLFDAVELSRREVKLYAELGRRLADLKRSIDAERAYTSTVEMQPHESESHTVLAEVREAQNRWPEAIAHWERVAELRKLEPTGLLKLATAQIHEKQWAKAGETLKKLRGRTWPERFHEVEKQTRELEKALEASRR